MRSLVLVAALVCCAGDPALTLVESVPIETTLDNPDIPDTHHTWVEMIDRTTRRLDVLQFYASNRPGSRLEPVIAAVERAARRGVVVRFLSGEGFAKIYPKTLERLRAVAGIEVLLIEDNHAKFFIADGREAFIGSQNFDWRALTHIQELGVRIRDRRVVDGLASIFALDWGIAGGAKPPANEPTPTTRSAVLELVASPRERLPAGIAWDLPRLVAMIDGANRSVRVQLLSYRDDVPELSRALVEAGARGVDVRLLVSNWNLDPKRIGALKALTRKPGIEVGFVAIPEAKEGFIPFARTIHSKFMVVDGRGSWVGTSNWSRSYFHRSRNVGVITSKPELGSALERFFARTWDSQYATVIDPDGEYAPPRYRE